MELKEFGRPGEEGGGGGVRPKFYYVDLPMQWNSSREGVGRFDSTKCDERKCHLGGRITFY